MCGLIQTRVVYRLAQSRGVRVILLLSIMVMNLTVLGCGPSPGSGYIKTYRGPGGTAIKYGLIEPSTFEVQSGSIAVLAVPTGHQTRRDAAQDLENLWSREAKARDWMVVCPISVPGLPYFWKDPGIFGDGPEQLIPSLLDHILSEYSIRNREFHVVEIGGNGFSGLSIAQAAGERVGSITIVPFLGLDYDLLAHEMKRAGPPVFLVFSEHNSIDFEERISARSIQSPRLHILRTPTISIQRGTTEAAAANVAYVCRLISGEASVPPISPTPEEPRETSGQRVPL